MFGIWPVIVNEKGEEMEGENVTGALCLKKPWPGMARTIYGSHDRFLETYFNPFRGLYFTGDGAIRHIDGYYQITGRMDDVINVSGHRLGTAEVEDALGQHPSVAESAVVGYPHDIKGEGVYAYVILKNDVNADRNTEVELRAIVRQKIAAYALPDVIQVFSSVCFFGC